MSKNIIIAILFLGTVLLWWYTLSEHPPQPQKKDEPKPVKVDWKDNPNNPINVCTKQGGIPITSAWDGRLTDCKKL